jgi:signal transduction histidine kinase
VKLNDVRSLCGVCSDSVFAHTSFLVDLTTNEVEWHGPARNPAVADAVIRQVRAGHVAAEFVVRARYGFYGVPDAAHPLVFAFIRDSNDKPDRIFGVLLDSAVVRTMIRYAMMQQRVYPSETVKGLSTHELLAMRVIIDGMQVFSTGAANEQRVAHEKAMQPVFGVTFEANVRESAENVLYPPQMAAEWPLLAVLVAVIALLSAASLVLVRREAAVARMRADFIASASHELRTPLAQIRMFTETLLLGRVRSDTERRRSLEIVDQEARRLSNLVDNLLAFSRSEGGGTVRIAPEPTHFADEIRRAIESFGPMARTSSVDMRAELQENVTAAVDRNALRQILVNLLDNAMKYGPAGQRITVGLALYDDAARVWVDDEGPGIPQSDRERVFESFYRMRRDIDARITGSGIGLAVVHQLAHLHAGDAWAEAAPGGGARIVVQFPGAYLRQTGAADLAAAS